MAVRLLAVAGKEVGEARALIAGDMFHDHGDAICFGIELVEKFVVTHLRDRTFSKTLVSAHAAPDFFEICGFKVCAHWLDLFLPRGHGEIISSESQNNFKVQDSIPRLRSG